MSRTPVTRYAPTPHGHIAYQVVGDGDRTMLYMTGTVSHVELRWETPYLVRLHRRLMAFGRVVTLDPLGLGASDPLPDPLMSLSEACEGYLAVLDAASAKRVSVVATQHGVAAALTIAATHPERVDRLVLLGGYARLNRAPDFPIGVDPGAIDAFLQVYAPVWGTGAAAAAILGLDPDEHERESLARLERAAAAPGAIGRLLRWITSIDVRHLLGDVQAPALVFGIPTAIVTPEVTRAMVDGLRDVRFIDVGHDPTASGDGLDEMMAQIAEFLTGSRSAAHSERRLAAILFTDLAGSTERAAELGDERWRDLLDTFRLAVRREIERHSGREVNTRGDDFLVVFDRASSAIECARELRAALAPLGLSVRSGIHVGEMDADGGDLTGIAVHVGARVANLAAPDEILVTTAAREVVSGMAWTFTDRGDVALKGVPGTWAISAVDS